MTLPAVFEVSSSSNNNNSSSYLTSIVMASSATPAVVPAAPSPGPEEDLFHVNALKWFFEKNGLIDTPSRRGGIDYEKELNYRQSAATFIQEMGQKLKVNQLCNNTAIVYMNRFYMFHSFKAFHRNAISIAAIFLAAKVEEQPRKLDHVVKVAHYIQFRNEPMIDSKSEIYQQLCSELVVNESILLQTLGFHLAIDHPHTHIIKCCQLVRASKDLGQVSYLLATNILHLTTMCVQYRSTLVAALAIHVACKWSGWQIPRSKEGKDWWNYVDEACTYQELEELTKEYLDIYNKAPPRLKLKHQNFSSMKSSSSTSSASTTGRMMPSLPPLDSIGSGGGPSVSSSSGTGSSQIPKQPSSLNSNSLSVPNQRSTSRSPSPKRVRVEKPREGYHPLQGADTHHRSHSSSASGIHGTSSSANGAIPHSGTSGPQTHPPSHTHPSSATNAAHHRPSSTGGVERQKAHHPPPPGHHLHHHAQQHGVKHPHPELKHKVPGQPGHPGLSSSHPGKHGAPPIPSKPHHAPPSSRSQQSSSMAVKHPHLNHAQKEHHHQQQHSTQHLQNQQPSSASLSQSQQQQSSYASSHLQPIPKKPPPPFPPPSALSKQPGAAPHTHISSHSSSGGSAVGTLHVTKPNPPHLVASVPPTSSTISATGSGPPPYHSSSHVRDYKPSISNMPALTPDVLQQQKHLYQQQQQQGLHHTQMKQEMSSLGSQGTRHAPPIKVEPPAMMHQIRQESNIKMEQPAVKMELQQIKSRQEPLPIPALQPLPPSAIKKEEGSEEDTDSSKKEKKKEHKEKKKHKKEKHKEKHKDKDGSDGDGSGKKKKKKKDKERDREHRSSHHHRHAEDITNPPSSVESGSSSSVQGSGSGLKIKLSMKKLHQ